MDVRNVHSRTIEASPQQVGAILDTLSSDADLLYPAALWPPDQRVRFDRPLGIGAAGGHGGIRYTVDRYAPGEVVRFRFDAGSGLSGTHGFTVEPLGTSQCRLTHTLECDVLGALRAVKPALLRLHDTYVEDMLDCAELAATGAVARPYRAPRWVRAWNSLDRRRQTPVSRQAARMAGVAVPAALAGIGAIHAAWALGWRWPGGSDQALAERVVGHGASLPSAALTWAVTGLLVVAAGAVATTAARNRASDHRLARVATWGVAGVLVFRGMVMIPLDLVGGIDTLYDRLDLTIYSPLCLALAAGASAVARGSHVLAPRVDAAPS